MIGKRSGSRTKLGLVLAGLAAIGFASAAGAVTYSPIGSGVCGSDACTFAAGSDGNVWYANVSGVTGTLSSIAPLTVSFGVGVTSPGGNPAAYAVGTDGNLYSITGSGSSWAATRVLLAPSGVSLRTAVGVISNTSNQPFVFLIGSDGNLWMAHSAGSWAWRNLGKPSTASISSPVGAVNVGSSYPQIMIIGSDGDLWISQYNGSSYPWSKVGTPSASVGISKPLFAWEGSNLPYAWVVGTDNYIYTAHQTSSGGSWTWTPYGAVPTSVAFPIGDALNDGKATVVLTPGGSGYESLYQWLGSSWQTTTLLPVNGTAVEGNGIVDNGLSGGPLSFIITSEGYVEFVYDGGVYLL